MGYTPNPHPSTNPGSPNFTPKQHGLAVSTNTGALPGSYWIFPEELQRSLPGRAKLEHEPLALAWAPRQGKLHREGRLPREDKATSETKLKAKPNYYRQKQADTEWVFPPKLTPG